MNNEEINKLVAPVENNWADLEREAQVKGKNLQETKDKADLSASLSDVDSRMKNLEDNLNTKYNNGDLRSVKEALKKQNGLRKQLSVEVDLLSDLSKVDTKSQSSRHMVSPLHSAQNQEKNKVATENAVREYLQKFKLLNPLIEQKQTQLEVDLETLQLVFDMNEELKWIEQSKKQMAILTTTMPNSLFEAQNVNKKQAELERSVHNHKPIIEKISEQVQALLMNQNPALANDGRQAELEAKCKEMEEAWDEILKVNELKKLALVECLSEQEAMDELSQIFQSITEKLPLIESTNVEAMSGKDEAVLNKHLVKLDQLEADLKGYVNLKIRFFFGILLISVKFFKNWYINLYYLKNFKNFGS